MSRCTGDEELYRVLTAVDANRFHRRGSAYYILIFNKMRACVQQTAYRCISRTIVNAAHAATAGEHIICHKVSADSSLPCSSSSSTLVVLFQPKAATYLLYSVPFE